MVWCNKKCKIQDLKYTEALIEKENFIDFKSIVNDKIWNSIAVAVLSKFVVDSSGEIEIYYNFTTVPDKKVEILNFLQTNEPLKVAYDWKIEEFIPLNFRIQMK